MIIDSIKITIKCIGKFMLVLSISKLSFIISLFLNWAILAEPVYVNEFTISGYFCQKSFLFAVEIIWIANFNGLLTFKI